MPRNLRLILLLFALPTLAVSTTLLTQDNDCLDYGDYMHWVGGIDTWGALGVAVADSYVYVADASSGLQVIDISDPTSPTIVGSIDTPGDAWGVAVAGTYAYVAGGGLYDNGYLQVIDVSDPASPWILGSVDTSGTASDVVVAGTYAYVADWSSGLQVIDISDPNSPRIVGGVDTPGLSSAHDVAVAGTYAYIAAERSGLHVVSAQCGLFIEATPDEAFVPQGGTLVQDVMVTNTMDSSRTVQAAFAARLPDNSFYPLLGPLPQGGRPIAGNASLEKDLNYPVPPNTPAPFVVGFLSFLLDYATGDTLDIDET